MSQSEWLGFIHSMPEDERNQFRQKERTMRIEKMYLRRYEPNPDGTFLLEFRAINFPITAFIGVLGVNKLTEQELAEIHCALIKLVGVEIVFTTPVIVAGG